MARYGSRIARSFVAAAAAWWFVSGAPSRGQGNDIWDRPPGGFWELGANWLDGSAPGTLDTATFNVAGAYLVEFGTAPSAIRELNLTAGNVTFNSPGAFRTLNVTSSLFGGPQDVNITNATLSLGTVSGFSIMPLHLTVGDQLTVSSASTLNVRFGSDVITQFLNSSGQVNVTGLGSALTASFTAEIDGGSLNVTAGGVVQNVVGRVGLSDGTFSTAIVSGAGSQWINTDDLVVGVFGSGTLSITGGGKVQNEDGTVGFTSFSTGAVVVDGAGSQWINTDGLFVGNLGSGTLNVTGGGSVSSNGGNIGAASGSDGMATITGGAWTMTGQLSVGGLGSTPGGPGTLNIQPAGTVSAALGVVLFPDAHVNLQGGTLDASAISYHQGIQGSQFQWTSGTLHVGTFNGNLTNSGGALAPGHSAGSTTINGNYIQVTGGVLEIEIGGPLAVFHFDFVNVTTIALLGGELDLTLTSGFLPTAGQTYAILIAGNLSGAFDNAASGQRVTTTDGGGSFLVNYGFGSPFDDNQVILSAFLPSVSGDFDLDGDVDGRDFLAWQRGESPNGTPGGPVSAGDLTDWQANYGFPPLTAASTAVPEPMGLVLGLMGLVILCRPISRHDFR